MVVQIYPTELQLNEANSSDTEAPFLDLNLSITNGKVSSKIYDKRDDFNFEIVNSPFLALLPMVYIFLSLFVLLEFALILDIMRQSVCLVLNPITVYSYGFLLNCTTTGQASDSMTALT